MVNIFVLIVVVLFSLKAFTAEEASLSNDSETQTSLEQKQIQMIKASIESKNLPKVQNRPQKS